MALMLFLTATKDDFYVMMFCTDCDLLDFNGTYNWFYMCIIFPCGTSTRFRVMASPYGISRSHSLDAQHSVGLLWTSDQLVAETSI